jgi:hypothetical protein
LRAAVAAESAGHGRVGTQVDRVGGGLHVVDRESVEAAVGGLARRHEAYRVGVVVDGADAIHFARDTGIDGGLRRAAASGKRQRGCQGQGRPILI